MKMVGKTAFREDSKKKLTNSYKRLDVVERHNHPCPEGTEYIEEEDGILVLGSKNHMITTDSPECN